jgi:hypothetical protein
VERLDELALLLRIALIEIKPGRDDGHHQPSPTNLQWMLCSVVIITRDGFG